MSRISRDNRDNSGVEDSGSERQLVSFRLGSETYAVDVNQVRSIGKVDEITHIPKMPIFVEGVMNLRGQITTVIDLRLRFEIEGNGGRTDQARIIVAEIDETQVGMIVDAVRDVIRVPEKSISPPPKTIANKLDSTFLTGICNLPDQLIMILDLSNILNQKDMKEVMEVTSKITDKPTEVST
jgi:purine-binding chemotaxis protein CheW